jgi:hypothetical protein
MTDMRDVVPDNGGITQSPPGTIPFLQEAQSVIDESFGDAIRGWGDAVRNGLVSIDLAPEFMREQIQHYVDYTNKNGEPSTQNELDKVFAANDGGDTNNDGVVSDAELGAWRPTDGRYGTNPNNNNNYSQNTLAQILRDGGVDSDGDGVFSNEEFYDYDALRQRRDGNSYGGVTAPGDANYQDPSTWNNPPAAELPPEQEIDNNPAPPPPPPPESSFTDFIPDSPLIDADATQVLIDRRDSESGLNLSILGILGAIFGDNLWIARSEPQLLDDVLKIFGVGVDDFYEENPTLNPESPDFVPPTNPNEEPPGEFPPDDGEEPPGEFPPNEGGEFPPNEGGEFPPSEGEFPPGEGEFPPGEDEFPPSENPDDNNDNDDDSDRGDDNGDDGMPSWLEDLLAGLLGIDRRDIPGGGTGVGIGEGGDGGDAESRSDSESTSSSDSSAESEATGGDAQATGGEATGGSADVNVEGSGSSIGDFLSQITNNFVEEAPDLVGAAAQDYLSQKYYVDALEKASDEELAFLKELMGRQDTFQIFRNLGLPAYNEDGTRLEDNTKVDYELNKLRRLVDRNLEDEYQIQPGIDVEPLIDEIGAVDPSGLGQINVADLLMNADLGQSPDAINTQVNQIDPFDSEDPALRFLQDEGRRAIESTSAAQGRLNSGGTLQELQNQAIGTAAQYAGNLADIGRLQDTSQLGADQQFYSQLLGSGEQDYSRGLGQLQAVADAQNQQDETALRGDIARFESELGGGGQQFDQSRLFNADELDREQMLYNEISGLLTTGLSGATGLTGNAGTFGTLGGGIYQEMGDTTAYQGLQKADRIGNVLGGLFNR